VFRSFRLRIRLERNVLPSDRKYFDIYQRNPRLKGFSNGVFRVHGSQFRVKKEVNSSWKNVSQHAISQVHKQQENLDYDSMCDKNNNTWNSNYWQPFLPLPDTDFRDYLDEIEELAQSAPEIMESIEKDLDDFKQLTIDSTAVKANSCWPTDARILTGLLTRANRLGQKLHIFGLDDFRLGWVPHWLEEMDRQEFKICLAAGKPKSKGKLKKRYRQLLKRGQKATGFLTDELNRLKARLEPNLLEPSRRMLLRQVMQQIEADIADAQRVIKYAGDRVFKGQTLPSTQKVLSLTDGSAAYIQKGSREAVIGYKPQLVRSANGFVTSLIVPQGNASDSVEFTMAIRDSIARTGVVAELVSTDDGYASTKGRDEVLAMGVKDISISGAKGKRLTDPDDWKSDVYRNARRERSAVESLMFTLKDGFKFGELGRNSPLSGVAPCPA